MSGPRIVWRTRKDAQEAVSRAREEVSLIKTRMVIAGTAIADALSEAQREAPDYKRIVQLLSKARAEHSRPLEAP